MKNGLYSAVFGALGNTGGGVIVANDGDFKGGDSAMYYIGDYSVSGSTIEATLTTGRHFNDSSVVSVFGVDDVTVNLSGTVDGETVSLSGSYGPVKFSVILSFIR